MIKRKPQITVSYRVQDASGHTLGAFSLTGNNKSNLQWRAERYVSKKYGKEKVTFHAYKSVEQEA